MAQSPSCAALLSQCGDHPGHANWDGSPTRAYSGALVAIGLPGGCGVKDSFCALDLAALGFQPLFDSTWLWRAPGQPLPSREASGLLWTCVQSASELAQWETAWSGSPANNPSSEHPRLFLPALLADPELVFTRSRSGDRLHRAAPVAGLDPVDRTWMPPTQGLHLTASSLRSCVPAASGSR